MLALAACTPPSPTPTTTVPGTATPTPTPTATIPAPAAMQRTAWSVDPYALGSQSFLAVGATPADRSALSQSISDRIFMAGEATSTDRAGTVTGAWLSGIAAAEAIAGVAQPGERIAILGAGMAGAAAARQLVAAGFDVVVLEARDRVGGRIETVRDSEFGMPVELGASILDDVGGNVLIGELAALEITSVLLNAPHEVRTDSGVIVTPPTDLASTVEAAIAQSRDSSTDISLDSALMELGLPEVTPGPDEPVVTASQWMDNYVALHIEQSTGASATDLSAQYGWSPPADASRRVVVGGFDTIVTSALNDIDVRLSSAVVGVLLGDDSVGLRFATGESFNADRIVVTLPLGVLKSNAIVFDPELPASHRAAIDALGMGAQERVILRFDEVFWQSDASEWSVVSEDSAFTGWLNLEPLTGEPVLVGTVDARQAARFAELADEDVIAEALASLAPFAVTDT